MSALSIEADTNPSVPKVERQTDGGLLTGAGVRSPSGAVVYLVAPTDQYSLMPGVGAGRPAQRGQQPLVGLLRADPRR